MNKLPRSQIVLLITVLVLYGIGFWTIDRDQQSRSQAISSQGNPPAGMKYLEYCEGGLSDISAVSDDTGCLAERPGDFAKFALAIYLGVLYLISLAIGVGVRAYRSQNPKHSA